MEWISVKDRLPHDNGRLQVFLVCRNQPSATNGKCLIETEYFSNTFSGADNITHWMPLPNPPEVKAKEEISTEILKELRTIRKHLEYMNKGAKF